MADFENEDVVEEIATGKRDRPLSQTTLGPLNFDKSETSLEIPSCNCS